QSAGVAAIRPGIPAREIFNACADVIKAMGFNDHARIERVGHSLGLDVHEPPSIANNSETIVEEGMVLTVEPIFFDRPDGKIGNFALEDVVVVTKTGHDVLSTFPKELWIA
ncbi:MAG: M24 family metallopeptidase, partial [Armatimonadota bacterium]